MSSREENLDTMILFQEKELEDSNLTLRQLKKGEEAVILTTPANGLLAPLGLRIGKKLKLKTKQIFGGTKIMAKMSENSIKILEVLQENNGTPLTAAQVAELADVKVSSVTGAVNSFVKKGYAVREDSAVYQDVPVKVISATEAGEELDLDNEDNKISENGRAILEYVLDQSEPVTAKAIAEALDIAANKVNGSVTALAKKGYLVREESTESVLKDIKVIGITEDGMDFDPETAAE